MTHDPRQPVAAAASAAAGAASLRLIRTGAGPRPTMRAFGQPPRLQPAVVAAPVPVPPTGRREAPSGKGGRPIVVEIVGPWGAGKGTLLATLGASDSSIRTDIDIWHLPRPLLIRGALDAFGTITRLFTAARGVLWREAKILIKLRAIHRQLGDPGLAAEKALVIDEGPVAAMSWLHLGGNRAVSNGGLASWWPRALRRWASTVDLVVFLDAPDPLLARRIRERRRFHPLQERADTEVHDTLRRYRSSCERVIAGLEAYGGTTVMMFRTDQHSSAHISRHVLATIDRLRNER